MSILIKIREAKNFSDNELIVAKYIVKNYKSIKNLTQKKITSETYTSIATLTRMAKKIGLSGFKELKINLIEEVSSLEMKEVNFKVEDIEKLKNTSSIIKTLNNISVDALKENILLQDSKEIEKIVTLIEKYEIIDLYGIGASYLVCLDMQYKFLRLGKQVNAFGLEDMQYIGAKISKRSKHLAIIISYSGMTKEMIEISKILEEKNIETVSITRYTENELIKHCHYNLYVTSKESLKRSAAVYSRIAMLNLVDVIYFTYLNKNFEILKKYLYETKIKK